MNERIRLLALEAGYTKDMFGVGHWDMPECKKFAELIVAECLDVVAMRIYLGPVEMCRQECKALASEIKEHFGVEE